MLNGYNTYDVPMELCVQKMVVEANSLGALNVANPPRKKGKKMHEDIDYSTPDRKVNYLRERAYMASDKKYASLNEKFHMIMPGPPKDKAEAERRLKAGEFGFYDWEERKFSFRDQFYWADPNRDQEGFDKAAAKLDKTFQDLMDIINIKSADDGLKALQEFEATEF